MPVRAEGLQVQQRRQELHPRRDQRRAVEGRPPETVMMESSWEWLPWAVWW